MTAGRFVLFEGEGSYITSWDTWAECVAAFPIEKGCRLRDDETGRVWYPGTRHEWEDAQT